MIRQARSPQYPPWPPARAGQLGAITVGDGGGRDAADTRCRWCASMTCNVSSTTSSTTSCSVPPRCSHWGGRSACCSTGPVRGQRLTYAPDSHRLPRRPSISVGRLLGEVVKRTTCRSRMCLARTTPASLPAPEQALQGELRARLVRPPEVRVARAARSHSPRSRRTRPRLDVLFAGSTAGAHCACLASSRPSRPRWTGQAYLACAFDRLGTHRAHDGITASNSPRPRSRPRSSDRAARSVGRDNNTRASRDSRPGVVDRSPHRSVGMKREALFHATRRARGPGELAP